jgi:hypothetical protein
VAQDQRFGGERDGKQEKEAAAHGGSLH